jgi:chorismate synthase
MGMEVTNVAKEFTNFCRTNFPLTIRFGDEHADGTLQWSGRDAVMGLPNGNVARVSLETDGTSCKYEKLVVRIVSLRVGEVDRKEFRFNEYLSTRSDSRSDYSNGFHVWMNRGDLGWYIATPSRIREELLSEVEDYVRAMCGG